VDELVGSRGIGDFGDGEAARKALIECGANLRDRSGRHRIALAGNDTHLDHASAHRIVEAFVEAASSGRTERLVALLTDDATGISDGAGLGLAAKLIRYATPERIAAAVRAGFTPSPAKRRLAGGSPSIHAAVVNNCPAMLATLDDQVVSIAILEIRDDKIAGVRGMAAPDRLGRLAREWQRQQHGVPLIKSW
jgi:hypothetical protein